MSWWKEAKGGFLTLKNDYTQFLVSQQPRTASGKSGKTLRLAWHLRTWWMLIQQISFDMAAILQILSLSTARLIQQHQENGNISTTWYTIFQIVQRQVHHFIYRCTTADKFNSSGVLLERTTLGTIFRQIYFSEIWKSLNSISVSISCPKVQKVSLLFSGAKLLYFR